MSKIIPLTKGKVAIVDDEDYNKLIKWKWHTHSNGYACRTAYLGRKNGKEIKKNIRMHREILGLLLLKGIDVDHKNGGKTDNRKRNLRTCTRTQNNMNRKKIVTKSSKYKGVSFCKRTNKWRVIIELNKKTYDFGRHATEDIAAIVYNKAAKRLFKDFALPNKIGEDIVNRI